MSKKVRLFGLKALPIWLLVVALVAGGAGAAVGTILTGNVVAEIPVTISQALEVGKPRIHDDSQPLTEATIDNETDVTEDTYHVDSIPQSVDALDGNPVDNQVVADSIFDPDRWIGAVNDTQTAFQFAAEINQHDWYVFAVPLKNASNQDMVVQLKMVFPEGITVEVMDGYYDTVGNDVQDYVENLTRTGLYTWKFDLEAEADKTDPSSGNYSDSILIVVAASDTIAPGFYTIEGELLQISY